MTGTEAEPPPARPSPAQLARVFHEDGFVALDAEQYGLSRDDVARVAAAVLARYEQFLRVAAAHDIDLTRAANAERIPGFYVRQGGRVDMEIVSVVAKKTGVALPDAARRLVADVAPVDADLFRALETRWRPVVDAVFNADSIGGGGDKDDALSSAYELEYIGCVVARPGDADQNWHLDGVHRHPTKHEPADRINVFVPLVGLTRAVGGTEMKRRSQRRDGGRRGAAFADYADLESVTHLVAGGTPLVMDYRVWHRGRANASADVLRPLLYFKYARKPHEPRKRRAEMTTTTTTTTTVATTLGSAGDAAAAVSAPAKKKPKRVALMTVRP